MLQTAQMTTPVGDVVLTAQDGALVGCSIVGQADYLRFVEHGVATTSSPGDGSYDSDTSDTGPSGPALAQARAWLERYFAGEKPSPRELVLAPRGTAFQKLVWRLLLDVPYGAVTTYGELAELVVIARGGGRMSAQAVGGAVGRNPLAVIVPCHRVLAAHGGLGGYGGGLSKKLWLLEHEGVDAAALTLWKTGRFSSLDAV